MALAGAMADYLATIAEAAKTVGPTPDFVARVFLPSFRAGTPDIFECVFADKHRAVGATAFGDAARAVRHELVVGKCVIVTNCNTVRAKDYKYVLAGCSNTVKITIKTAVSPLPDGHERVPSLPQCLPANSPQALAALKQSRTVVLRGWVAAQAERHIEKLNKTVKTIVVRNTGVDVEVQFWPEHAHVLREIVDHVGAVQINMVAAEYTRQYGLQCTFVKKSGWHASDLEQAAKEGETKPTKLRPQQDYARIELPHGSLDILSVIVEGDGRTWTREDMLDCRNVFLDGLPRQCTYTACAACKKATCECGGERVERYIGTLSMRDAYGSVNCKFFHETYVKVLSLFGSSQTPEEYGNNGPDPVPGDVACTAVKVVIGIESREGKNELVLKEIELDEQPPPILPACRALSLGVGHPPSAVRDITVDEAGQLFVREQLVDGVMILMRANVSGKVTRSYSAAAAVRLAGVCAISGSEVVLDQVGPLTMTQVAIQVRARELVVAHVGPPVPGAGTLPKDVLGLALHNLRIVQSKGDQVACSLQKSRAEAYGKTFTPWEEDKPDVTPQRSLQNWRAETPVSAGLHEKPTPREKPKATPKKVAAGALDNPRPKKPRNLFDSE